MIIQVRDEYLDDRSGHIWTLGWQFRSEQDTWMTVRDITAYLDYSSGQVWENGCPFQVKAGYLDNTFQVRVEQCMTI
jgi:hypothetical protein